MNLPADTVQQRLEANNVFTIARRSVDVSGQSQELIYMSIKFVNNIWVLMEVKVLTGDASVGVSDPILTFVLIIIICMIKIFTAVADILLKRGEGEKIL